MAREGLPTVSIRDWLIAASVVPATAVIVGSLLLFFGETIPFLLGLRHASKVEQSLFGFQSFGHALAGESLQMLSNLVLGPLLSVPLGFLGAAIFLWPALALAALSPRPWIFAAGGASAGAVHAVSGALLTNSNSAPGWLLVALGYLPYSLRSHATLAFGCGAVAGGALAGYLYGLSRRT